MRIANVICSIAVILACAFSDGVWAQEIPKPTATIRFDQASQLQVEGEKLQLVTDPTFGKVLKTDQVSSVIGWDMAKAKMNWEQATISFWVQPIDWSGEARHRQWLFTKTPSQGRSFNLVIGQFATETDEVMQMQLLDLGGTRPHLWNHFSKWENGKWYCITATWKKEKISFYLNGELDPVGHGTFGFTDNFKLDAKVFKDTILYLGTTAGWSKYDKPESTLMSAVEIRDVCLSPEDVRRLYYAQKPDDAEETVAAAPSQAEFPEPPAPRLFVPSSGSVPTIDGAVNDEEWSDAAVFYGLNDGDKGVLTDKPFLGYLKSDGVNLYFAFKSKVPSMEFLVHEHTERDSNTPLDDSWELFFYPDLKTQDFYQIVVNSEGAIFDWYAKNVGWNGNWTIKQRLGSPDVWDAEVSIPLAELGLTGDLEGKQCRIGLYVNQKAVENRNFTWSPLMGLFEQPDRMGTITFRKNAPLTRLTSLGKPTAGLISPTIGFTQADSAAPSASVTLTDPSGKETKKVISTSGEPVHFDPLQGTGKALLTVVSPPDASPQTADYHYSTLIPYDSIPVTVKLTNYPSREEATVELNYGAMNHAREIQSYRIGFGAEETHSQVIQRASEIPWEKVTISTKGLKPGPLTCKVELLDEKQEVRLSKEVNYIKEGNEPWLHNTVGIEKGYVPPPYTPMVVTDGKQEGTGPQVEVIGRTIELGATGLPNQLISAGGPLLAFPVKIAGQFDGKSEELTATTPFAFTETAADDSIGESQVKIGSLTGTLKQTISFDGLCWYEIELKGKANAKDTYIEIPLTAEAGRYYQLTDIDFKSMGLEDWDVAGVLKKDLFLPFTPHIYLGNDQMGLSWMAETHKTWQMANDKKVVEVRKQQREGKEIVLLKINLVDDPIDLDGITISFGIQPTPVKPVTEKQQRFAFAPGRWPGWHESILSYGVYIGQDPTDAAKVVSYAGLPEPQNPELSKALAVELDKQGYSMSPYGEITWLSLGLPEMQIYGGDWYLNQPWAGTAGSAANSEPFGLCDMENPDYQDFIVWRFVNAWDGYGGKSVYFDLFSPMVNKLPEHNRGYKTRAGKTAYPMPIRATRNVARRLYIGYKQKNPEFAVFTHASNLYTAMVAFGDAWPIGEQFGLGASRYPEVLTYERYRAFLYGYPIGVKTMFLPSLKTPSLTDKAELTSYLTGVVLNHNNNFWICFINQPILLPHLRVYNSEPWSLQKFLPYWEHPKLTNLDPSKFKVSGWYNEKNGKGLLLVASLSPTEVSTPISLGSDWMLSSSPTLSNPIDPAEFGSWDPPATFDGKTASFKPYGVLMLEVKQ